jgi:hypothetical protein
MEAIFLVTTWRYNPQKSVPPTMVEESQEFVETDYLQYYG